MDGKVERDEHTLTSPIRRVQNISGRAAAGRPIGREIKSLLRPTASESMTDPRSEDRASHQPTRNEGLAVWGLLLIGLVVGVLVAMSRLEEPHPRLLPQDS